MPEDRDDFNRQRGESLLDRIRRRQQEAQPAGADPLLVTRPHDWPGDEPDAGGVTPRMLLAPHERDPQVFIPREQQEALLFAALDGVRLGEWDRRIVRWLGGLDASTVLPLVAMIRRSRAVGAGEGWAAAVDEDGG